MSGPVFPDLRQIIQEGLAISSWIFTIEQCGLVCLDSFNNTILTFVQLYKGV
jgi:hypothetical protein